MSRLDSPSLMSFPGAMPWRYIMVADNACRLLEQNDLVLNLNGSPRRSPDVSWLKPGKVIRETSLSTKEARPALILAEMNLRYVEFDAGWYGNEYDNASGAAGRSDAD